MHQMSYASQSKSSQAQREDLSLGWIGTNIIKIIKKYNPNENFHTAVCKWNITGHRLMSFLQIIKVYLSGKFHSLNLFNSSQRMTNQGCLWELAMDWHHNWEKQVWIFFYSDRSSLKRVMVSFHSIIFHLWASLLCDNFPSFSIYYLLLCRLDILNGSLWAIHTGYPQCVSGIDLPEFPFWLGL